MQHIYQFLQQIAEHNDREWFHAHQAEYKAARQSFEAYVQEMILRIAAFDPGVAYQSPKTCIYRFARDTRFSEDKSPYKRHFGAFVCSHGRKSYRGGYYLHLQPGDSMVAGGSWCPPAPLLKHIREAIVEDIDRFRDIVEEPEFKRLYPVVGTDPVKTMPKGFPRDFAYPEYLRPRLYTVWSPIPDSLVSEPDSQDRLEHMFRTMAPFNGFLNEVFDEWE
ncbi:MAG: DUF2461 domain-containing protein [Bacteroidaceae bacterium]|nr:DUF2461 domain-containing protein [Bacteroidaceae bacterium]MBR1754899.1 DUF2461 domain-containing protein [Bacteroidaceae bacterium]